MRTTPVPDIPKDILDRVLMNAFLDEEHRIDDTFSQGFFLRSLVLSPDGSALLNPQATTVVSSSENFRHLGYFAYAQTKAEEFLPMLEESLRNFRQLQNASR